MNANVDYILDILFVVMGLYILIYLVYGRIKRKPLFGEYHPGTPGFRSFLKLVDNNKYLSICAIVTVVFAVRAVIDARAVLAGDAPDSVLVVAPIAILVTFIIAHGIMPSVLGQDKKNKK